MTGTGVSPETGRNGAHARPVAGSRPAVTDRSSRRRAGGGCRCRTYAGCPDPSSICGSGSGSVPAGAGTARSSSIRTANGARPATVARPTPRRSASPARSAPSAPRTPSPVREPYGVWGGFSESERLRLLAVGWEDLADRRHSRVDIARLEARLGRPHKSTVPAQRQVPVALTRHLSHPRGAASITEAAPKHFPVPARRPTLTRRQSYLTVTRMVCQPEAPLGAGSAGRSVCTSPGRRWRGPHWWSPEGASPVARPTGPRCRVGSSAPAGRLPGAAVERTSTASIPGAGPRPRRRPSPAPATPGLRRCGTSMRDCVLTGALLRPAALGPVRREASNGSPPCR